MPNQKSVTMLLNAADTRGRHHVDRLYATVYDELYRVAQAQRGRWHGHYTMNATALVHEAYLRLIDQQGACWNDRTHFFAVAATAMRQILINYAERQQAAKRGGPAGKISLGEREVAEEAVAEEIVALDEALRQLARRDKRQSQVVEYRFFLGLSIEETAEVLGVSPATVKRDWRHASAWLHQRIRRDLGG